MPFETLSLGLTLTLPTSGTRNWGSTLKATTWTKLSQHQHKGSGDGLQMVTASYSDNSVTAIKLATNLGGNQGATLTPVGTTQTVSFNTGNIQNINLGSASGDVTFTLTNPVSGAWYHLWLTQGATARDVIWPAAVKWPQAQKPILSTTNGAVDYVALFYNGTVYRGLWELDFS